MPASRRAEQADSGLLALAGAVRNRTGLAFTAGRGSISSLERAIAQAGAADAASYAARLDDNSGEFDALVAELTIGETYFMRESAQLEFIEREVFPQLTRDNESGCLSAWSAGCATGEEAYSLAILGQQNNLSGRLAVIGTDVARHRLRIAKKGVYGKWSLRGVPEPVVSRHFHRAGSLYSIAPALRAAVSFRYLNLRAAEWISSGIHSSSMDLILCRNVLIYLDQETVARVAMGLIDALTPNGWLFLGTSDPPLADLVPCEVVVTGSGLAYRRPQLSNRGHRSAELAAGQRHSAHTPPAAAAPIGLAARPASKAPVDGRAAPARPAPASRESQHRTGIERKTGRKVAADAIELYGQQRYEEACEIARDLVSSDPALVEAWIVLVRGLSNLGRLTEAGLASASAMDLHRTSAELAYMHAVLLQAGSRLSEAATAFRRALYLDPQMAVAHLAFGDLSASQGDTAAALRSYLNAERILERYAPGTVVAASDGNTAEYLAGVSALKRALLAAPGSR